MTNDREAVTWLMMVVNTCVLLGRVWIQSNTSPILYQTNAALSVINCNNLFHKALVGQAPQYIADLIRPVADLPSRASSRSALSGNNLFLTRTRKKFGDRAFAVAAPRVWNTTHWHQTPPVDDSRQHLSNAVLKLFCLIGASLNICKWFCTALPVF